MVVIAGRSKASGPWFLRFAGRIGTTLVVSVAVVYAVLLLWLWRSTTTPLVTSTDTNNGAANDSDPASSSRPVIGYAVSVTGCGSDPLTEG
jgi:hypothetical protein